MTNNLDIYKDLKIKNTKRLMVYKKLFKLVEKYFPYLKRDVLKAYIKDNKNTLFTLYKSKRGNGENLNKDNIIPILIKSVLKKLKKHYGGADLADIVSALRSSSTPVSTRQEDTQNSLSAKPNGEPETQNGGSAIPIGEPVNPKPELVNQEEINKLAILTQLADSLKSLQIQKTLTREDLQIIIDAIKSGQEENPNSINVVITGFFADFAENMPQWYLVQEYSKDFDSFKELMKTLKIEKRLKAADEEAELRIAVAMAKLGALFTPSGPMGLGPAQKINKREQEIAAAAISDSGIIAPPGAATQGTVVPARIGGAPNDVANKSNDDKEKDAANKMKEQNEELSKTKKDANELSQIISQLLSEYNKSYSFEANDLDPTVETKFVENKENELKRILTNGELSNDERSLVSKWASIKEEQKWIDGLGAKITKAKELYENIQKVITKLASAVQNDPELAEILRNLGELNDGAENSESNNPNDTIYNKYSLPTNLSNILNEINAAYKLVYKGYNNAGEAVTKRLATPPAQNSSSTNSRLSAQTIQLNNSKTALLTKIKNKIKDIVAKQEIIKTNPITNAETIINDANAAVGKITTAISATAQPATAPATAPPATAPPDAPSSLLQLVNKLEDLEKTLNNITIPQISDNGRQDTEANNKASESISKITEAINFEINISYDDTNKSTASSTNTIQKHIENIKSKVDNTIIRQMIRVLDMKAKTQLSPEYGVLNDNPTLLDDIYNHYLKSKASDGKLLATINLENMLNANNLIPSEVLKITTFDKMIFAFIIILLRLVAVTTVEYMIDKGWILSLANTIITIGVIYTLLFVAFVMIVNFDLWRLRILFNYVNLHVNTSIILTHLAIVWGFFGIILLLIYNINFGIAGLVTTIATDEDKAKLQYRIEMITALIWVVILILVAVF